MLPHMRFDGGVVLAGSPTETKDLRIEVLASIWTPRPLPLKMESGRIGRTPIPCDEAKSPAEIGMRLKQCHGGVCHFVGRFGDEPHDSTSR